jgi:uncharacterized membrane protein
MSAAVAPAPRTPLPRWLVPLGSALLVAATVLAAFRGIWQPATDGATYPWGSDTLGHLIKAEYLQQEIAAGHFYPNIFPAWYSGVQLMRYYPPLPYYVLALINLVTRDMIAAGHWYVVLAALAGALSFLSFARWVGWAPAALGALLFALAPDNLRVALAEGNLPRILATALLPGLTYCLLRLLTDDGQRRHAAAGALLLMGIVLSHAMMGAIFGVSLGLLAVLLFLIHGGPARRVLSALGVLAIGLALSGWWLLPSLSGGISTLDQQAVTEALAIFPLTTYLNPFLRFGDREILYVGLGLSVMLLAALFHRAGRRPAPLSLTLVGAATVLISTPGFNDLFNGLPAHQLFWPIRFLSFSALALTLALMFQLSEFRAHRHGRAIFAAAAVVLLLDAAPSLGLAFRRPAPPALTAISRELTARKGWRVATLDFSRFGSAPTYFFTAQGGREQIFGWAYQGARTAANVASLNGSLETGAWGYAVGALDMLGADDVVLLKTDPRLASFAPRLEQHGFAEVWSDAEVSLYHRAGGPRAFRVSADALGIGPGAQNFAAVFPGVIVATSPYVDDYDLAYLARFRMVVLSRFNWRDQDKAEALIRIYAEQGGQVLVDLNGAPDDELAREPRFLDVYGERVRIAGETVRLDVEGQSQTLLPFAYPEWQSVVPQGHLESLVTFDYHGVIGTVLGYESYGQGRVWFVGLNLPFHTLLTNDPAALDILARVMTVPAGQPAQWEAVSLDQYRADRDGYAFDYAIEAAGDLLVPVADHGGAEIRVDGHTVESHSLYNLVGFTAPAGKHHVTITFRPTAVYGYGALLSLAGLLAGALGLWKWKGKEHEPDATREAGRARQRKTGAVVRPDAVPSD